jgi:chromosome segregation ATPase
MADSTHREPATGTDDTTRRIHQLEEKCRTLSERAEQADRELRSAKAEVEVKNEYAASVEAELEEALAFLRTKTAYIESLPWIRLKVWFNGLRRR